MSGTREAGWVFGSGVRVESSGGGGCTAAAQRANRNGRGTLRVRALE